MTETQHTATTPTVTMLYDGSCPLCSREVSHYRRIDTENAVTWIDIATDRRLLNENNISYEAAMQHLHVLSVDGTIKRGAYAFAEIWQALPYYRYLARLVSLPGILPLLDRLYQRFARWRYARRSQCNTCA